VYSIVDFRVNFNNKLLLKIILHVIHVTGEDSNIDTSWTGLQLDYVRPVCDCVTCLQSNQSINQKRIRVTKVTNVTARPLLKC